MFVGPYDSGGSLKPFRSAPGCIVAVVAEFDGFFIQIVSGEVRSAVTDAGEDILPTEASARRMRFPYYTDEKRTKALLYVNLRPPGSPSLGLSELSGVLRYTRASSSKEFDLGFERLEEGATGKELDARVTSVGTTEKLGKGRLEAVTLSVSVPKREVSALIVRNANGETAWVPYVTELSPEGRGTIFHVMRKPLPEDPQLAVAVWEDITTHEVTFEIEDTSWQCMPLK
jgi:hypothetical protein